VVATTGSKREKDHTHQGGFGGEKKTGGVMRGPKVLFQGRRLQGRVEYKWAFIFREKKTAWSSGACKKVPPVSKEPLGGMRVTKTYGRKKKSGCCPYGGGQGKLAGKMLLKGKNH